MAAIDLKDAIIRIIDGYENTGAVNDTPANNDTTITVDAIVGVIPVGTKFTFENRERRHFVTAQNANERQLVTVEATAGNFTLSFTGTVANPIATQTTANIAEAATAAAVQSALEALAAILPGDVLVTGSAGGPWTVEFMGQYLGLNMNEMTATDVDLTGGLDTVAVTTTNQGGNTHEITFTPAIVTADGIPADDDIITFAGRTLEVTIGEGNITYTENREMEYRLNRGRLDTVREGDEQPVDVSMDFEWSFITASAGDLTPTIEDALKRIGLAADWDSSSDDPCEPYAVDIEIEHVPPCEDVEREIITLPDFRWESLEHNASDAQVSGTGRCNTTLAEVVRAA